MKNLERAASEQRRLAYERIINLEKRVIKDALRHQCKVYAFDDDLHRVLEKQNVNHSSRIIILCHKVELINDYINQMNAACDAYDATLEEFHIRARRPDFHIETTAKKIKYFTYDAFSSTKTTADKLLNSIIIKAQMLDDEAKVDQAKEDIKTLERYIKSNSNQIVRARRYSGKGLKLRIVDDVNKNKNFSISDVLFCLADENAVVEKAEDRMSSNSKMNEMLFHLTTLNLDIYPT